MIVRTLGISHGAFSVIDPSSPYTEQQWSPKAPSFLKRKQGAR